MDVHGTKLARTLFTIAREWNGVPPNKGMELTVKSDTPFARRRAKGAPLLPAAHPRRSTAFHSSEESMAIESSRIVSTTVLG
jgi:hypothetical protein